MKKRSTNNRAAAIKKELGETHVREVPAKCRCRICAGEGAVETEERELQLTLERGG